MYKVTEGVESMWNYHISHDSNPYQSLCGKQVMPTFIPLEKWGEKVDHIPMSFCTRCKLEYDMAKSEHRTTATIRLRSRFAQIMLRITSYIRKRCVKFLKGVIYDKTIL